MSIINSIPFFVGYDEREDTAYRVCEYSINKNVDPKEVFEVKKLVRPDFLNRDHSDASTNFAYSRFLVPYLCNYEGWAIFCDCDFLFLTNPVKLLGYVDPSKAVTVAKHDYWPLETSKMDGQIQTQYPRKNWSSLIIWNCGHPINRILTPESVNTFPGSTLHQFKWVPDSMIGELDKRWNWLEGWYFNNPSGYPKARYLADGPFAVHYTRGGPWFKEWKNVEYADKWHLYHGEMLLENQRNEKKED